MIDANTTNLLLKQGLTVSNKVQRLAATLVRQITAVLVLIAPAQSVIRLAKAPRTRNRSRTFAPRRSTIRAGPPFAWKASPAAAVRLSTAAFDLAYKSAGRSTNLSRASKTTSPTVCKQRTSARLISSRSSPHHPSDHEGGSQSSSDQQCSGHMPAERPCRGGWKASDQINRNVCKTDWL